MIAEAGALPRAAAAVRERLEGIEPRAAVVLGSGLGALSRAVESAIHIPYAEIPGFPAPTVAGHAGELIAGTVEGVPVILQSGRFHLYEGHDPATVVLPARVFAELEIGTLIVTNAAGGLRPTFRPPLLMSIADHLNLMWRNPLLGAVVPGEERFPDMSCPYDAALRGLANEVARDNGIDLEDGVYAAVLGPSYETPAEVRMLQRIGADAVGMSTVPEVLAARARGVRVFGVSSITNWGAGLSGQGLAHEEVLAAGQELAGSLETIIRGVLPRI
jgi:purine-nucleoside phosphorylase